MKNSVRLSLFAVMAVAFLALVAPAAHALSTALGELQNTTVSCGATATLVAPGMDAVTLVNTSTTCINIGGPTVSPTTGAGLGSGCGLGMAYAADVRRLWCSAASGTLPVTVLYGVK